MVCALRAAGPSRWRRLARFPLFWLGALLLAWITVQASNSNWQYFADDTHWWLAARNSISWLPTSVLAPATRMNAWRQLALYADVWLLMCSLWVGVARRKSVLILLGVLASDALASITLLVMQRAGAGYQYPDIIARWTPYRLTSSFVSRNQAGAYFALCTFAAISLAIWSLERGERTLKRSTPAGVFAIAALAIAGGVAFSLSRGAVIILGCALAALAVWFLLRRRQHAEAGLASPATTAVIVATFAVFLLAAIHYLDFSQLAARLDQLEERHNDPSVRNRIEAHHAAAAMLKDNWLRGVGVGGFRYLFPGYVRRYPDIYQGGSIYWEHAHCDWMEIPIELGLGGDILLALGFAIGAAFFVLNKFWRSAVAMPLTLGCCQTLAHAWFDFPFQCPAILLTWSALMLLAAKWLIIASRSSASVEPQRGASLTSPSA